jgi:hypothetical protein
VSTSLSTSTPSQSKMCRVGEVAIMSQRANSR